MYLFLFCFLFLFTYLQPTNVIIGSSENQKDTRIVTKKKKPKIVILSSKGGYSHVAVSRVIIALTKKEYEIEVVYIFDKIIRKILPFSSRIFKVNNGDQWYNQTLQKEKIGLIHLATSFFQSYIAYKRKIASQVIDEFIKDPQTVMLISLVPFVNGAAMLSAKKKSIPLLIVSLDPCLKTWIANIKQPTYENAHILLSYDLSGMKKSLKNANWPTEQWEYIGRPVRQQFYLANPDKKELKKKIRISPDKFTIMIMSGGSGCRGCDYYVKELIKKKFQGHVIVAAGRDEVLLKTLQKLKLPKGLTATYLGFTYKIATYMAAADLLFARPSPGILYESVVLGLPVLVDYTKATLRWEKPLVNLVEDNRLGTILYKKSKFFATLEEVKKQPQLISSVVDNIHTYRKQLPKFEEAFLKAMKKLLEKSKKNKK